MDEDAALRRLGEEVARRRKGLYLTVAQAATSAPMVASTWTNVEQGRRVSMSTWAGVERVLGWERGSVRAILAGGEPVLLNPKRDPAAEIRRLAEELPRDHPGRKKILDLLASVEPPDEEEPPLAHRDIG